MKPILLGVALFTLLCCLGLQVYAQPPGGFPPVFQYPLVTPKLFTDPATSLKVGSSPAQCKTRCLRRNIRDWSPQYWSLYAKLYKRLNEQGLLEEFILPHGWSQAANKEMILDQHQSKAFLTWHRLYLVHLEQLLQKADHEVNPGRAQRDGEFCLGYWDWSFPDYSNSFTDQVYKYLFNPASLGTLTTGNKTIPDGAFKDFRLKNANLLPIKDGVNEVDFVLRDPTPQTNETLGWSQSMVKSCLALDTYEEPGTDGDKNQNPANFKLGFRTCILAPVHGTVHASVGGTMGKIPYSGVDPTFWVHHAMVDYLWWVWQKLPNKTYGAEVDFSVANPQPYQAWKLEETKDYQRFCYDYAPSYITPRPKLPYSGPNVPDFGGLDEPKKTDILKILKAGETKLVPKDQLLFIKYMAKSQEQFDRLYFQYVKYTYYAQLQYKKIYDKYYKTLPKADQAAVKAPTLSAKKVLDDLLNLSTVKSNVVSTASTTQSRTAQLDQELDSKASDLTSFLQSS